MKIKFPADHVHDHSLQCPFCDGNNLHFQHVHVSKDQIDVGRAEIDILIYAYCEEGGHHFILQFAHSHGTTYTKVFELPSPGDKPLVSVGYNFAAP